MNTQPTERRGRKAEEKAWGTTFRHVFNVNYMSDPDLHTLMFTAEAEFNNVLRQALREYMEKHNHKAKEPEFQARVFIQASTRLARGINPSARDILLELGEEITQGPTAYQADAAPVTIKTVRPAIAPTPVQVAKVQTQPVPVPVPVPVPAIQSAVNPSVKPVMDLDLGPELDIESGIEEDAGLNKGPVKNKWLQNHNY
jgi:hypothetical protein